ncbi:MAG: putative YphP/YqiW family bacilliredoxin [Roseivirga sp.]|jgi:putative YphP/YqiW family bacilliredoxin
MYPEHLLVPFRQELIEAGFTELKSADAVDEHLKNLKGTSLLVINSVCGCAAGTARPGVRMALKLSKKQPDNLTTVFAGGDIEATEKVRQWHLPYPPSSPSVALFKDGELVHFVERHHIEGRTAEMIGGHLAEVFEEFCEAK